MVTGLVDADVLGLGGNLVALQELSYNQINLNISNIKQWR